MKLQPLAFALTVALASLAPLANANLIQNGSFENDTQAPGSFGIYNTLSGGWSGLPNIELRNSLAGTAQSGNNFVELDTTSNSGISQTFTVETAGDYVLSFFYASRPGTSFATNGLTVDVTQGETSFLSTSLRPASNPGSANNWLSFSQSLGLLAPGAYTLSFFATGTSDSFGTAIDNISVVPEPGSLALMLAGLGVVGFLAGRRRVSR